MTFTMAGGYSKNITDAAGIHVSIVEFAAHFTSALAQAAGAEAVATPWPELNEEEVSGLIEQYSAPEWIEYR